MPRGSRKEPKPYTLKCRRGERPYQYSEQYMAWRRGDPAAHDAWMRRFGLPLAGSSMMGRRG